jgi:hypothetical protein
METNVTNTTLIHMSKKYFSALHIDKNRKTNESTTLLLA